MTMRRIYITLIAAPFILSCAAVITQFYPDSYFPEDRIYQNKPLGFSLTFKGAWEISTDPAKMGKKAQIVAGELHKSGRELLFVGSTVEGTHGTRGIACNLNLTDEEYLRDVRENNSATIEKDLGDSVLFPRDDLSIIKWEYLFGGFHFAEFFFTSGTYNIRIAFWTAPESFARFIPVYEEIIGSISFIERL